MTLRHKNLAEWLKYWRKEFNLTQAEVGDVVGVSKQHISNLERQQQHATSGAESRPSIEVVDKLARLFNRPIREARILADYEKDAHIDTIEEALDSALFFDQKGLSEDDKAILRPLLEVADREIERLLSQPTHTKPSRAPTSTIRSPIRKQDKIDEAIDTALAFGGKPVSEKDRQTIREIIEKREAEKSK